MSFYEVMVVILLFAILIVLSFLASTAGFSLIDIVKGMLPGRGEYNSQTYEDVSGEEESIVGSKEYDEKREIREREFDKRISAIREEILNNGYTSPPSSTSKIKRTGNIPDIADGIYNLPHGDVEYGYDNDGYEEVSR